MRLLGTLALGCHVATTAAFPAALTAASRAELSSLAQSAVEAWAKRSDASTAEFDAASQLVDVTGSHKWQAPQPGDARGPCPGLNALANHGYIPRIGVATVNQFITAATSVFGMGNDLATILAAFGGALDGEGALFSIAGKPHLGIAGSHNNFETDSSSMRGDLNQYGNNYEVVISQFKELFDMQPDAATANYDLDVLSAFRESRFNQSVSRNPYFYYGPFTGTVVSQAAFIFIYRFMANHTAANPEGVLDQTVLKSFYAMSGSSSDFTHKAGYERIPDNWYKQSSPYGIKQLGDDISSYRAKYPYLGHPGCNMGKVNTYHTISQDNTSASAYNFEDPTDGFCYGIAVALNAANNVPIVNGVIDELLLPLQNALACPVVDGSNLAIGKDCPGYSTYGGPTGRIAPGAIKAVEQGD